MKQDVTGIWRSYKIFHFSGRVEANSEAIYYELSVDAEQTFSFLHSQSKRETAVYRCGQWRTELLKKRLYIYLGKMQAYEIITLESQDLVLLDVLKGEKIFFAKMPEWYRRIEPAISFTRHIAPEKETNDR